MDSNKKCLLVGNYILPDENEKDRCNVMKKNPKILVTGSFNINENELIDVEDVETFLRDRLESQGCRGVEIEAFRVTDIADIYERGKRPQKLIDANNLNWNGLGVTQAFLNIFSFVLARQEEIKQEKEYTSACNHMMPHYDDPCNNCSGAGTIGCLEECPYSSN